ncbi:MAG: serine/threonine protein kinase [Dehalococcoidia bacterium]
MPDVPRPHIADYAGQRLGRYDVLELVERTHLSVSYKAADRETGQIVVLTLLNTEHPLPAERRQRFRQECSLVARLNHPNIIRLLAYHPDEELPLMAFEDLEGQLLSDRLGKPWPYEIALPLLDTLADALDYAHRAGVIHRAFGPIRVTMQPNDTPTITGFAVPRILGLDSQLARDGTPLAPPEYLSPEQLRGQPADARSDIYAFAVLAYEMLAGEPPFRGNSAGARQNETPRDLRQVNPQAPVWVGAAINKALEPDPRNRFQSMRQFADALRRNEALATPPRQASSEAAPAAQWAPPVRRLESRRPATRLPFIAVPIAAGVALIGAFLITAFVVLGGDDDPNELVPPPTATAQVNLTPTATATSTPSPLSALGLALGDTVNVVNTGTGLRLRAEPAGDQIGTIPDGTPLTLVGGPTSAQDIVWWQIESTVGNGWVAEASQGTVFLAKQAP